MSDQMSDQTQNPGAACLTHRGRVFGDKREAYQRKLYEAIMPRL